MDKIDNAKFLIIVAGATAVGKTSVSMRLAKKYGCPIFSADSRQIYKELTIGVAKPTKQELEQVRHYFINHISVSLPYSVGQYEREAIDLLDRHFTKSNIAVCCGGTGLYLNALRYGIDEFPKIDLKNVAKWENIYKSEGIEMLQEALSKLDPEYYATVDKDNHRRLVRALSVIEQSQEKFSTFLKGKKSKRYFRVIPILLQRDRAELYDRINRRVDLMLEQGLEEELRSVYQYKDLPALATVGYREMFAYMDGLCTREEAIEKIKQKTRNYAKRQITWFKKHGPWIPFHPKEWDKIVRYCNEHIIGKNLE